MVEVITIVGESREIVEEPRVDATTRSLPEDVGRSGAMSGGNGVRVNPLESQVVQSAEEPDQQRRPNVRRSTRVERKKSSSNQNGRTGGASRNGGTRTGLSQATRGAAVAYPPTTFPFRERSSKRFQIDAKSAIANGLTVKLRDGDQNEASPSERAGEHIHDELGQLCLTRIELEQAQLPQRERIGEYFPWIHDELGQLCLTKVSRSKIYKVATVCKKWKNFLLGPELYKARRSLAVKEDWVFILGMNVDKKWRAFRPTVNDWIVVPPCPSDYVFDSCDKESMVAGLNLLVLGQGGEGYVIWRFDTIKSVWSTTPKMHTDRCLFGSSTFGEFAYFAGGTSRGTILKSVERYNSETDSWESLPDMNTERKSCSGFVMDGKFHVIGGQQQKETILHSGEVYDPVTKTWTQIEGMWPQAFVPSTQVAPPLVAVLNNELYGINIIENMLMRYDKQSGQWHLLEKVPHRAENTNGWGLGFKAVGDELYVIGGARGPGQFLPAIHAYRPRTDDGEKWRYVTDLRQPTSGFIYNCAVMSG